MSFELYHKRSLLRYLSEQASKLVHLRGSDMIWHHIPKSSDTALPRRTLPIFPLLLGGAIHGGLGGRHRVAGGHQATLDAKPGVCRVSRGLYRLHNM